MSHADIPHAGPDGATPSGTAPKTDSRAASATRRTALLGAMFLMATSAIGPGFITQTATFTVQMGAAFAFAILVSILIDIAVQMNVWRVIGVSGMRAQELANRVLPGLGWVLAALVFLGGMVFNIGNIAGTGLGANAMLGVDPLIGGGVSALIALLIFLSKRAGVALDRIVVALGAVMILLMLYVAITSAPPVGEALRQSVMPEEVDFFVIVTLVGGTIGGYITYAGAHRMIDSGVKGVDDVQDITRSSVASILVTGLMRALLFLAILGVVASGAVLSKDNLAASAFQAAAGDPVQIFHGERQARTQAAHGEGGADYDGQAELIDGLVDLIHVVAHSGAGGLTANGGDDVLELLAVLAALDGIDIGADELDIVLIQNTLAV